jgi:hypothetical protein
MEAMSDGQWTIESAKMITVDRVGNNGSRETVRAIVGHHTHRGTFGISIVGYICSLLMFLWFHFTATLISSVFAKCIEQKHGVADGLDDRKRELQRQRPQVQRLHTNGMFMYFLQSSDLPARWNQSDGSRNYRSNNEIESFYLLFRAVVKKVSIVGVNAG